MLTGCQVLLSFAQDRRRSAVPKSDCQEYVAKKVPPSKQTWCELIDKFCKQHGISPGSVLLHCNRRGARQP